MDTDEWELLAVDGLLDSHEDGGGGGGGKIYSRRRRCHSESVLDMDHFRCPPSPPPADRIATVAIGPDPEAAPGPPGVEEVADLPAGEVEAPSLGGSSGSEREITSRVFFKKVARDGHEFVDMTMGEAGAAAAAEMESLRSPPRMGSERSAAAAAVKDKNDAECETGEVLWEEKRSESEGDSNGLNSILKRGFTGIGALCSFGVAAAATFCVLILGSRQGNDRQSQQKQNLRFQLYSDDKRIKKVVHHATKPNKMIAAVRGVPHTRAHIIVGGYYDTL
ncbi:uncharacterized protein LOC115683359 [Syzygium oleosum]|uniref:uncharacterized protein LOC115683359 n=1 Tax=Syzygium oleosum TaxID=219896 RepID=UPI0024BA95A9|nr:uncharacterized protein LOC115683359 [Syzygium oleosum]